jgi:uncharacterized protein YcbK (DUF882 family)
MSRHLVPSLLLSLVLLAIVAPRGARALEPPGAPPASAAAAAGADSTHDVMKRWLGLSGNLRAIITTPAQAFGLPVLRALVPFLDEHAPGMLDLPLAAPDGEPLRLFSLIPFQDKRGAQMGPYRLGRWPQEKRASASRYDTPEGFIEVTEENADTPVSKRFRVRDFLTHDQTSVWPKYLVLQPALLDKLELLADELERAGKPSAIRVMSGFRSPQYNTAIRRAAARRSRGPARDSRHMYGDAADIVIDADGDGRMDDLDGDGRVTSRDALVLRGIVERIEEQHPELIGGIGTYRATRAHGPFVHVDVRGTPARW